MVVNVPLFSTYVASPCVVYDPTVSSFPATFTVGAFASSFTSPCTIVPVPTVMPRVVPTGESPFAATTAFAA